jgi:hypothetical protein
MTSIPASRISVMWIVVAVLIVGILFTAIFFFQRKNDQSSALTPSPTAVVENPSTVSPEEQQEIDAWIETEDLNEFADPKESMYAGGTPLFDETNGKYTDRYEYILKNHPDRPWEN